jgi:hypothetical protein
LKSVSDFQFVIAITIAIEKLIRIDRDPNFISKSISEFPGKIASILEVTLLGAPLMLCPAAWASPAL